MSRTLLDINADFQALDDLLAETEGEITPEAGKIIDDWLAELDTDLKGKVDSYAAYVTELTARVKVREEEAARLRARAKTDEKAADWLKYKLKVVMEDRRLKRIDTLRYRVSVCGNGGKQPLNIFDPHAVPHEVCKHIPEHWEPDGDLIRDALIAGKRIPGVEFVPRGTHLRIG